MRVTVPISGKVDRRKSNLTIAPKVMKAVASIRWKRGSQKFTALSYPAFPQEIQLIDIPATKDAI